MSLHFEAFPKLPRMKRGCIITEKIDGTNAQVNIWRTAECGMNDQPLWTAQVGDLYLYAGSRTRLILPGKTSDNYGFAGWVRDHAEELATLGEGRFYGEWWGKGIQRGYGLDERRFSLFQRYGRTELPPCVSVVPELFAGDFSTTAVDDCLWELKTYGSKAAPGFFGTEGVVVFHTASRQMFKVTHDDNHKEAA